MDINKEMQRLKRKEKYNFEDLKKIMHILRNKCPWDKKQTFESLTKYIQEEAFELIEAILKKDIDAIKEEAGDLFLQPVFISEIAKEKGYFDIDEVIDSLCKKLIFRHPHVFGTEIVKDEKDVLKNWEKLKEKEKKEKEVSVLDKIKELDPIKEAYKLQKEAAKYNFDWKDLNLLFEKVKEEFNELSKALKENKKEEIEEEIGDLLFVLVNLSRHLSIDPSLALRKSNMKFRKRFSYIERKLKKNNKNLKETSLEELEKYYQEAKKKEKNEI